MTERMTESPLAVRPKAVFGIMSAPPGHTDFRVSFPVDQPAKDVAAMAIASRPAARAIVLSVRVGKEVRVMTVKTVLERV